MRMIRIHVYQKGQIAALLMIQQLYLQIMDPMGAIIMFDRKSFCNKFITLL